MSVNAQKIEKRSLPKIVEVLLNFSLSEKFKFAVKVSLSIALAYLIPFAMGWNHATTAATTVMLIAAIGSVSESVSKGAMRVLGTVIGAAIGITLIAFFPQDRMLYLFILSVFVTLALYLARAYKGDNTIFFLAAMVMLMVFKSGEVDDVFLYGVERTFMTIFGIIVYTLIGVFLWPMDIQDNTEENATALSLIQSELFVKRDATKEERVELREKLLHQEQLLDASSMDTSSASMTISQWHSIIYNYKNINEQLSLLSMYDKEGYAGNLSMFVSNYEEWEEEISVLLHDISEVWKEKKEISLPDIIEPEYQWDAIMKLTHLERASLLSTVKNMQKLYEELQLLAQKLNSVISPIPTFFAIEEIPKNKRFLWGDIEHLKGSLVTFMVFWSAVLLWITVNPPGGFMIVTLATVLSMITTFTPVKPSMLIVVFSFSFIFAILMYVFVLPNLHYGWELGVFIFIYSFISFYWINPKLTLFFLLGLFTFGLANVMSYNFSGFLLTLMTFYIFLFLLHFFYYIPFSTKPEHLFLTLKRRFFMLAGLVLQNVRKNQKAKHSWWITLLSNYGHAHLMHTVKQIALWSSKLDLKYFHTIEKDKLANFSKECEQLAYLLQLLSHGDIKMRNNPFINKLGELYDLPSFMTVLNQYAADEELKNIDSFWKDREKIVLKVKEVEGVLDQILSDIDFESYSKKEISELYEYIFLRRNIWLTIFSLHTLMEDIDFTVLQRSRF